MISPFHFTCPPSPTTFCVFLNPYLSSSNHRIKLIRTKLSQAWRGGGLRARGAAGGTNSSDRIMLKPAGEGQPIDRTMRATLV
jgi:hypothetical protein